MTVLPPTVTGTTQATTPSASTNPFDGVAASVAGSVSTPATISGSDFSASGGTGVEAPPGAATSSYQYQEYVSGAWMYLGTTMAAMLGLSPTTAYQGDTVVQAYEQLSTDEQANVDRFLYNAGYYTSTLGTPLSTGAQLGGGVTDTGFEALSAAILDTSDHNPANPNNGGKPSATGANMSSVIAQKISSGAGLAAIRQNLTPQEDGGNTYQVNLTSPQDIYSAAYTTFEQTLGRAPTKEELSAITATLQAQETSYAQAQNAQAESMSETKYGQAIASRNAVQTPNLNTGAIPNGPFTSPTQYAVALLEYMGAGSPGGPKITDQSVALLATWITKNGGLSGGGTFNPLGAQINQSGATANANGTMNYQNWAQGIQATANLLSSPQYSALLGFLMGGGTSTGASSSQSAAEQSLVSQQLSQWSNGAVTSITPTKATLSEASKTVAQYVPPATTSETQAQGTPGTPGYLEPNPSPANVPGSVVAGAGSTETSGSTSQGYVAGGTNPGFNPQSSTAPVSAPTGMPSPATVAAANANPQVRAYLEAQAQAANSAAPASPTSLQPGQIGSGQGVSSPGDAYIPSSTLTDVSPPSASSAAFTAATTGANAVPYLGNQYLQAYQNIMNLIKGEV